MRDVEVLPVFCQLLKQLQKPQKNSTIRNFGVPFVQITNIYMAKIIKLLFIY